MLNTMSENLLNIVHIDLDQFKCGKCTTTLQEVCWLTEKDSEYNELIPGQDTIEADQKDMVAAVEQTVQPIWRPNTTYYLHFKLKDVVDNGENEEVFDYYYGFRTVGPIGHYHKHPEVSYLPEGANPEEYPLTSLARYIDYQRSFPNADGNLLQAKPLFYANGEATISLFFTQPLTYHMFRTWEGYKGLGELQAEMVIAIKDPASDVVIPYPLPVDYSEESVPLPEDPQWESDDDPRIPLGIRVLNNFIEYINENTDFIQCELAIGAPLIPPSFVYKASYTNLRPQKLYTAMVFCAFDRNNDGVVHPEVVHQFTFQTSRYSSFEEQVQSYRIEDEAGNILEAIFSLDLDATATDIDLAYDIVSGRIKQTVNNELAVQFQHRFDRALEGALGLSPLDPPQTTEFNVLKSTSTGDVVALLVRCPEPFNIPKMPLEDAQDTIVVIKGTQEDSNYKVLLSKDYSQALIMHSSKEITATELALRFAYKVWDGKKYEKKGDDVSVTISIDI